MRTSVKITKQYNHDSSWLASFESQASLATLKSPGKISIVSYSTTSLPQVLKVLEHTYFGHVLVGSF